MASTRMKIGLVTTFLGLGTLSLLVYAMMHQSRVTCEVCVTFHGGSKCRAAAGPNAEQATKTATDNACGYLASGMTDSVSCSHTQPDRVSCSP